MTSSYPETLDQIVAAFRSFSVLAMHVTAADYDKALACVNRAESFGAFVDPTAYRQALADRRLERQRRLLDLFSKTTRELRELFPEGWPEAVERMQA